jgi:hypothetical protein
MLWLNTVMDVPGIMPMARRRACNPRPPRNVITFTLFPGGAWLNAYIVLTVRKPLFTGSIVRSI